MSEKLTAKQDMFCREYLVDLNGTQAAIRAGYAEKTANVIACENLTKPNIVNKIQELMDARAEKVEITSEYVLRNIKKVCERCMQEIPVLDEGGNPTGEYQFKEMAALKALEMLGRHLKLFTDVHEHQVKVSWADMVRGSYESIPSRN